MANPESGQKNQSGDQVIKRRYLINLGSADTWTALATIGLIFVGIWGVIETKRTLELSERAWIAAVGGQVTVIPEKTKAVHFSINFSNSGHEPAVDINSRINVSTVDSYESEYTDIRNVKVPENTTCEGFQPFKKRAVIPPNITFGYNFDTLRAEPAIIADDAIISGTKFLVINGCLAYRSFEKNRHTSFCYIVEAHAASTQAQNITVMLTPGQPPVSVPTVPAPNPGAGKSYIFAPCATGFEAD